MSRTALNTILTRASISPTWRAGGAMRCRGVTTLSSSPSIYVFPDERSLDNKLLTLLPTSLPNPQLAIGSTTSIPPTPDSIKANPKFLSILQSVLKQHAHEDPGVKAQAMAFASGAGSSLGSGGVFFPQSKRRGKPYGGGGGAGGDGAGGASAQGGMGGAGRGGYIHVSDERAPPGYGRIADPEDIFGSLEVDGEGEFVDGHGNYQDSGTYRIVTREGILGLPSYLREKLVNRLKDEEAGSK